MDEIVALVRQRARAAHARHRELVPVVEELGGLVERVASAEADALAARLEALEAARRLVPVEPSTLKWNPLRAFGFESAEIRWTKWLASLLDGTCGRAASRVTWSALCHAIGKAADGPRSAFWQAAASEEVDPCTVWSELTVDELGRADLVVEHAGTIAVIENKLDAGWHDGVERTQAEAYEAMARRLAARRGCGAHELVLLRNNEKVVADGWIVLNYSDLASSLRLRLKESLAAEATTAEVVEHIPVLATVHAIEQDLLGLRAVAEVPTNLPPVARWHRLRARFKTIKGSET